MTSQTIILYILKTTLVAGILLAYYWMALRDKKFHYYNRFYLLCASAMSLLIPLLNFNLFTVEEPVLYGSNQIIKFVLTTTNSRPGIHLDWTDYVLLTASTITIILIGLLLMHIIKIQLLKKKYEVTKMEGFDFINTKDENAPFSFLNNLFWKQSISLQDEGGQQIFKHELTHIKQKHTWDRIYCQIVASIFWMNPFNWVIQNELVAIHEFIADEEAVGNSNVHAFAQMLLQTHYGNHFLKPTHSFFYSTIKRRLAMLTQTSNPKYSYLRRVMLLPLLVITISLVSIKVHAREKIEKKVEAIKENLISFVADTTKPTIINIKADTVNQQNKPVYFVDGVKITEVEMNAISADKIKSVNVLKGDKALKKYPNEGKNGVIEIVLKDIERKDQTPNKDWSNISASQNLNQIKSLELVNGVKVEVKGIIDTAVNNNTPLYVLDGSPIKSIVGISPTEIESINILKDAASKTIYGDAAKNGVVLITSKKVHAGNLQHKTEDVTVIGYTKNGDKSEPTTVFFHPPTIQKNVESKQNNEPIFYTAQKPAQFPGGGEGWIRYLGKNLNRDIPVLSGAPVGQYKVILSFIVTSNGDIKDVTAVTNPGYGTAAEAIRIIEKGPKWIPAEQNGKKVNYFITQSIAFKVDDK
jgi:TonB-dependent SusC/RagA subfamily outer membrane receptor